MSQTMKKVATLQGKLIMTDGLVGQVLNDTEKDTFIVLHVLRVKHERRNDVLSQMAGWAPFSIWWVASDKEMHATREQLGPFEVLEKMPEWLEAQNLNQDSGRPFVTVVDGKAYVDW